MKDLYPNIKPLDENQLKLEWYRFWSDILKWLIGGTVVVIGFLIIRPQEQNRLNKALQLEIHKAYIAAVSTEKTELWQRQLNLLKAFSDDNDTNLQRFLNNEQIRLDTIKKEKNKIEKLTREYSVLQKELIQNQSLLGKSKKEYSKKSSKKDIKLNDELKKIEKIEKITKKLLEKNKMLSFELQQSKELLDSQGITTGQSLTFHDTLRKLAGKLSEKIISTIPNISNKNIVIECSGFNIEQQYLKTIKHSLTNYLLRHGLKILFSNDADGKSLINRDLLLNIRTTKYNEGVEMVAYIRDTERTDFVTLIDVFIDE